MTISSLSHRSTSGVKHTGNAKEEATALHETPYGPGFKHFGNTCDIYDGGIIIYVATEFW